MQHVASFEHPVARCCMKFDLVQTSCNIIQHRATRCSNDATMLGDVACNMLRSFERALRRLASHSAGSDEPIRQSSSYSRGRITQSASSIKRFGWLNCELSIKHEPLLNITHLLQKVYPLRINCERMRARNAANPFIVTNWERDCKLVNWPYILVCSSWYVRLVVCVPSHVPRQVSWGGRLILRTRRTFATSVTTYRVRSVDMERPGRGFIFDNSLSSLLSISFCYKATWWRAR